MTDHVHIPPMDDTGDGPCWSLLRNGEGRTVGVLLTCPNNHRATMDDHEIDENGMVTPSLLCGETGCGWHVFGHLEGWDGVVL